MPAFPKILAVVFLLTAISSIGFKRAEAEAPDAASAETPSGIVARWLKLHRVGDRQKASALTTGSRYHGADVLLPAKRDTGVRVARSLGNERVAAVVTTKLDSVGDDERVLLFWLARRDGVWRINKSYKESRRVVDERIRGFLEAGDVRWYVQRDQLLGRWQAGPCRAPIVGGLACGSQLELGDDNRYRLAAWGPGGPLIMLGSGDVLEGDDVVHGAWRLINDRILMSHQGQTHECRVVWLADNVLVVQSPDGEDRATYERDDTISVSDQAK